MWFNSTMESIAYSAFLFYVYLFCTRGLSEGSPLVTLQGTANSYAAYARWDICTDSKLKLEFKSHLADGLLVYMNGGEGAFMEVKLIDGGLKMRLKFRDGKLMNFRIGEQLNDTKWHKMTVLRSSGEIKLTLDQSYQTHSLNIVQQFDSGADSTLLYVGGLPHLYVLKLDNLSLPTVFYEPRFSGSIANVSYKNCSSGSLSVDQSPLSYEGLRISEEDDCSTENPCENGGRCLSTSSEVTCDCQYTRYSGSTCSAEHEQTIATFFGSEHLYYNFTGKGEAIVSSTEIIRLSFKTTSGEGLLFYTGASHRYLNIGLLDGVIYMAMDMGDGEKLDHIGTGRRFDDNLWHSLYIKRYARELAKNQGVCTVFASIDDMYETSRSFSGHFSELSSQILFVGGATHLTNLPGTQANQNFHGCIKGVQLHADSLVLSLLKLAKIGSGLIMQYGDIKYGVCQPVLQVEPVAILSPSDFIVLQKFASPRTNFLSMSFKTSEKEGLLVYASGRGTTVFALEIFNGFLYLILDHAGVLVREKIGEERVNTDTTQQVSVTLKNWGVAILLNDLPKTVTVGEPHTPALRLTSPVSLAGLDYSKGPVTIHPAVYTAGLRKGFVGCLNDVKIDGTAQNLKLLARQQGVTVSDQCIQAAASCKVKYCKNEGICEAGWGRATCHCQQTAYTGARCTQESVIMRFDGGQHFTVTPRVKILSIAEDISIQFRTRHSNGALLSTRSKDRQTGLEVFLYIGKLYIQITLNGIEHLLEAGEGLNDYQWYSLTLTRRSRKVKVILNTERVIDIELPKPNEEETLLDRAITVDEIKIGQPIDMPRGVLSRDLIADEPKSKISFTGHIRQFIFNNVPYTELAYQGNTDEISHTSVFSSSPVVPSSPVSIGSAETYVAHDLPHTSFYSLYLQLKTSNPSGLILYRHSRNGDYFALEIIQGVVRCVYSVGGQTGKIESKQTAQLSDNKWHDIVIMRLAAGSYYLIVDEVKYANTMALENEQLQLNSALYIAGVPSDMYAGLPPAIKAPYGFIGCLASLDVNGVQPDLITEGRGNKNRLAKGCHASETCTASSCKNSGSCVQTWPSVTCNCDLTSFTGPACADDGTTYHFGSINGGLVIYTFSYPKPDSTQDKLAFGFMTTTKSRATLFKLTSSNSMDLLEIFLLDGLVKGMYNIGRKSHTITVSQAMVNDGQYHVLKFIRSGSNATLQIDHMPKVQNRPKLSAKSRRDSGAKLSVLNSMDKLYIGSDLAVTGAITHPYNGLISGITFNSVNLLDLAKSNHPTITIQGDARIADLDNGNQELRRQNDRTGVKSDLGDSGEIVLPSGGESDSNCQNRGGDPDFCNEDTGDGELISMKIEVTEQVSARVTKPPPPVIEWPTEVHEPVGEVPPTTRELSSLMSHSTISSRRETPQSEREIQPLSTVDGPFDLQKNLPLIAGICGAALVTAVLIGVIIYRLTRKQEETYSTSSHRRPSCSVDDDLRIDVSTPRADSSTTNMSLPVNSLSRRPDGKEWYV